MRHLIGAAFLAIGLLPTTAGATPIGAFSELYLFGDSLSDSGNAFILDALTDEDLIDNKEVYPNQQFTNGDVWATQLGLTPSFDGGSNFAIGGATAAGDSDSDLAAQIARFQTALGLGLTLGPDPLGTVSIGGNDLRNAFLAPDPGAALQAAIVSAITEIVSAVTTLKSEGIHDVVVMGVPDLGQIPETLARGDDFSKVATAVSVLFNENLRTGLANAFADPVTGASDVRFFDLFGLLTDVVSDPTAFGFEASLLDDACVLALPAGHVTNCDGYLFYDNIHPTEAAHTLIAEAFTDLVAPIPLPAGMILILTGLGALGAARRLSRRA